MKEHELYDMDPEQLDGLKERLRNLSRNLRAKGVKEMKLGGQFLLGESFESGNLTVDIVTSSEKLSGPPPDRMVTRREAFMLISRDGELSVRKKHRDKVKKLNYELVLEELANI